MKGEDYQSVNSGKRKKGFLCVPNYWLDDFYSDEPERRNKARIYLCLLNIRIRYDGHFTFVQFPPEGVPKDVPASDGKESPPAKPAKPRTPPAGRPNYNRFKDKES